ncbi:MAG: TerC family protein [Cryobacterium sp.]|nr:TerC family protein [Oligoflexia bacterium]
MSSFFTPASAVAFLTLFVLELVLGIDNVIFISIISARLPADQQNRARVTGLSLAVITRVLLLLSLSWLAGLTAPLFQIASRSFSGRDLILMVGGLFLLGKSTFEIHAKIEGESEEVSLKRKKASFAAVIAQILILDIVFSLDSVITAVGMVDDLVVMIAAVICSTGVMVLSARRISDFVDARPTIKMLALSFLILIGCSLIGEGLGSHIPKGTIYFSMAFSAFVEFLNQRYQSKRKV